MGLGLDYDLACLLGLAQGRGSRRGDRHVERKACESNPQWASKHTSFVAVESC